MLACYLFQTVVARQPGKIGCKVPLLASDELVRLESDSFVPLGGGGSLIRVSDSDSSSLSLGTSSSVSIQNGEIQDD